jgi:hypothetical protein
MKPLLDWKAVFFGNISIRYLYQNVNVKFKLCAAHTEKIQIETEGNTIFVQVVSFVNIILFPSLDLFNITAHSFDEYTLVQGNVQTMMDSIRHYVTLFTLHYMGSETHIR